MRSYEFLVENVIGNKLHNSSEYNDALNGFIQYYGNDRRAKDNLDHYISDLDMLNEKGGDIYRVLFVKGPEEIRFNIKSNRHWTTSMERIEYILDNLSRNSASSDSETYVIKATVPPNSLSNHNVDVAENPEEEEVNIVSNLSQVKFELFLYSGGNFISVKR